MRVGDRPVRIPQPAPQTKKAPAQKQATTSKPAPKKAAGESVTVNGKTVQLPEPKKYTFPYKPVEVGPAKEWGGGFGKWLHRSMPGIYHALKGAMGAGDAPVHPAVMYKGVVIVTHGCSPTALEGAQKTIDQILTKPEYQKRVREEGFTLNIIPKGRSITSLPEFERCRGLTTMDGRPWDEVRSVTTRDSNRLLTVAVGEEKFVHGGSNSDALFELGGILQYVGLSDAESAAVDKAFESREAANGPWIDVQSSYNTSEYFSQATLCYFRGKNAYGEGPDWIKKNDPALFQVLSSIYGPR